MSEKTRNPIERNLEKMLDEGNEMNQLLMSESIGGNAGYYKGKACFAANFYYDGDTGEISRFTNDTLNGDGQHRGTFRLIAERTEPSIIVNRYITEGSSRLAKAVLSKTEFLYNIRVREDFDRRLVKK